uniref:TOG domain-containing protein n=1 Tax=Haemonchus contortus TaxID=6289 RepID=A0A7I4Y784_HAECO
MTRRLECRAKLDGDFLKEGVLLSTAWISQRDMTLPIKLELVLRLRSVVERIEIIAHDLYIPQQVAIATLDDELKGAEKKLGVVHFKPATEASSQQRTIYVDVSCTVITLQINKAHEDEVTNPFHQVGLESVLVFGRYLSGAEDDIPPSRRTLSPVEMVNSKRFTEEIDELLRRVKRNKDKFVREMDFSQAKRAQLELNLLKKARGEMVALENAQSEAVKEDNFHRAVDLQDEIKTLRRNVMAFVDPRLTSNIVRSEDIHRPKNLFDKEDLKIGTPELFTAMDLSPTDSLERVKVRRASTSDTMSESSATSKISRTPSSPNVLLRTGSASSARERSAPKLKQRPSSVSSKRTNSSRSVATSASGLPRVEPWHGNKFLEKENTVVPALRDKINKSDSIEESSDASNQEEHQPLVVFKGVDYSRAVDLFGEQTARNLYSKKWQERKIGLARVQQKLESVSSTEAPKYLDCTIAILQRHLKDPLYNVYASALDLLGFVCTRYIVSHHLQRMAPNLARSIHSTIATRANDTDRRSSTTTLSTMNEILEQDKRVAKAFLTRFLKPLSRGSQRGQATIVQNAAELLGTPNDEVGSTEDALTQFGLDCLRNADPEVRSIGKKLILDVYANGRRDVIFQMVSREEQVHQHPLLRSILDDMVAINSAQARSPETSQSSISSKLPNTKSVRISDDLPRRNDYATLCRHCGANIEKSDSSTLEKHYRNICPAFTKCEGCNQVVLVMSLASHRRNDCLVRGNYRTCPRCGESIERSSFHRHVGRKDCRPVGSYATKCPLCAALVPSDDEESWKKHLTMQCKHNPRRRMSNEIKRNTFNSFESLPE